MKAPEREPIYVNPDIVQGDAGTSIIAPISMNSPIIYGENPNLTTNQYGQTEVIQTPIYIGQPITPQEQAQQIVEDIKQTLVEIKQQEEIKIIAEIKNQPAIDPVLAPIKDTKTETQPTNNTKTETQTNKDLTIAKTNPATIKKTKNYLIYGAIGVGAVIVLLKMFKK